MHPLISVVIPTARRPQYLPRAVGSALAGMQPGQVEVIVVPNGPDSSWRESLAAYSNDPAVRVLPIEQGHANLARNHGLRNSRGAFVRFLDDDDYLIPEGACAQLEFARANGAEFCSGRLANIDADGVDLGVLSFPETRDFGSAAFGVSGFTIPAGNIILRECLANAAWNGTISRGQDNVWMLDLAASREWRWRHFERVVGVWWQHPGQRVSTVDTVSDRPYALVDQIMAAHRRLVAEGRMSTERADAVAEALWHYVHRFFPFAPQYWSRVAARASEISPAVGPRHPVFKNPVLRSVHPLHAEWLMLPLRRISSNLRRLRQRLWTPDYRRRL